MRSPPGCCPRSQWQCRSCPAPTNAIDDIDDIDDTVRQTYGYAKQGAGRYTGIKGLNALLAIVSTAGSAPLIVAARLRKGSTNSARGAAKLLTDALATARPAGAVGIVLVRADSAYYGHDIIAACHHRRVSSGRSPVLGHRPAHPGRGDGHHRHRRPSSDPDPLPERDLRRGRAAVGV